MLLFALACAHSAYGPSSDQRLEAAVESPGGDDRGLVQGCDDQQDPLAKARNVERTESERLRSYMEIVRAITDRADQNTKAMAKNPNLAYGGGKDALASAETRRVADSCRELLADSRREFEELVRDLFSPLLVLDVQSGHHTRSARVSLNLLRSAVQELAPPDSESLNDKLTEVDKILKLQKPQ